MSKGPVLPCPERTRNSTRRCPILAQQGWGTVKNEANPNTKSETQPNKTHEAKRDLIIAIPSARNQPIPPIVSKWLTKYTLRNVGCTAMHLAYVAAGAVDACICHECKIWDIAAGHLLIQESGGTTTDLKGQPLLPQDPTATPTRNYSFLTAAPDTHAQLFKEMTKQ